MRSLPLLTLPSLPADSGATPHLSTVAALSLSVVSSVSLVIVNKYLISTLGFPYGASPAVYCTHRRCAAPPHTPLTLGPSCPAVTTLTAAHLVVTALGLELATRLHLFDAKPMDNKCVACSCPAA